MVSPIDKGILAVGQSLLRAAVSEGDQTPRNAPAGARKRKKAQRQNRRKGRNNR